MVWWSIYGTKTINIKMRVFVSYGDGFLKWVFFDVDRTLLDHDGSRDDAIGIFYQKHHSVFGSTDLASLQKLYEGLSEKYFGLFTSGKLTHPEQGMKRMQELFGGFGKGISDSEATQIFNWYVKTYKEKWKLFPDALPCLQRLQKAGHCLGAITDGKDNQQRAKIRQIGAEDYFTVIKTSGEVGYAKPDSRIFLAALAEATIEPNEADYVGDSYEKDVLGALGVGMGATLVDRNDSQGDRKCRRVLTLNDFVL